MTEIRNDVLGDSYYEIKHKSGLTVLVYPKEGYSTTYAIIGTNYGSIDTVIRKKGQAPVNIPEGTAHYLEHKLFESEELDAFELFAKTGASANAYTSFNKTCYLFSCSSNFRENLKILLGFVQNPYFTEETVRKEQGIIGQEIRMYQDEPGWQVMFNLLRALYVKHPVRVDIAGTTDTIAEINADLLYECYNSFYSLSNMVLAVAGSTTPEEVMEVVDAVIKPKAAVTTERGRIDEPAGIAAGYTSEKLAVSIPLFALGYKEVCDKPILSLKDNIIADIILDYIADDTRPLYNKLLEQGLISIGFSAETFNGYDYHASIFSGQSKDPEAVAAAVKDEIRKIREEGFDESELNRIKKMYYGRCIMAFNSTEGIANELITSHFSGYRLFDELGIYSELTVKDFKKAFENMLREDYSALSVILPQSVDEA